MQPQMFLEQSRLNLLSLQIDVAVNAPEAGTIKEFLAEEEDTVTVGQDLVKLELGGAPQSGETEQASQEPKSPAPDTQPTSSDPEPSKDEAKPKDAPPPPPPPPSSERKQEVPKQEPPRQDPPPSKPAESKKPKPKSASGDAPFGNRDERRVRTRKLLPV